MSAPPPTGRTEISWDSRYCFFAWDLLGRERDIIIYAGLVCAGKGYTSAVGVGTVYICEDAFVLRRDFTCIIGPRDNPESRTSGRDKSRGISIDICPQRLHPVRSTGCYEVSCFSLEDQEQ